MKSQPRYKKGDKIGGRYQVHDVKMGGMGEVYLCLDLEENYPYVLKTFQQRYLTDLHRLRRAFEQEVATWVELEKHPNIVRCFWMQIFDGQSFMCLEWIAGEEGRGTDLRGWLRRGPLELKLALEITLDICNGLIHAQAKQPGLVHRDLKPENILMVQGGLAKITDFGLAQIVQTAGLKIDQGSATTNSRQSFVGVKGIAGTPAYMAPEQWRGEPLDERTDIYALGCILYEMLTGKLPFTVDLSPTTPQQWQRWLAAMQTAHESAPYPKLTELFTMPLGELLAGCLAKVSEQRFAGLAELLVRLVALYQAHFAQSPPIRPMPSAFTAIDYNNRGVTYAALRQYERALADFDGTIALDPNFAPAYSNRGATHEDLQEYDLALADFEQAIALDPTYIPAYINRGNTHRAVREYELALADYDQTLALDPNDIEAYVQRGLTYADLQDYGRALADYGRAIALDPTFALAYTNRGNTHKALQEYELALADFEQAIALDSNLAQTYASRGNTYRALQEYDLALVDYGRAIALDPNFAPAYTNRGNTYADLREYERALADYERAIELDSNSAQAYANRGLTYHMLHAYEQALADFEQAIALDPNLAQVYASRGNTHFRLQAYEQALANYKQVIALDPNDANAYLNIGVLFYNQGRFEDALVYFEQAVRLGDPTGAQYATAARQRLEQEPAPHSFTTFVEADSLDAMRQAVVRFPLLLQTDFIVLIEQYIRQEIPVEERPMWQQRLRWLRQVVGQQ